VESSAICSVIRPARMLSWIGGAVVFKAVFLS
jgi:hypothetical protein